MLRFVQGDLAAVLRVPAFRRYSTSRIAAAIAQSMLQAIIAWQVFAISGSALDLGIVGLVRFVPALLLSFVSGVIVDTYDRRLILLARPGHPSRHLRPDARRAGQRRRLAPDGLRPGLLRRRRVGLRRTRPPDLIPALVPRNLFSRAMTLNSTLQSLCAVTGPADRRHSDRGRRHRPGLLGASRLVLLSMVVLWPVRTPALEQRPVTRRCRLDAIREGLRLLQESARSCSGR